MLVAAPVDPFEALADPSTVLPLAVAIAGPSLRARFVADAGALCSTGEIAPLPTPWQRVAWDQLCDDVAAEDLDGDVFVEAALRRALATGSARLPLATGRLGAIDVVRLPSGSALFEVRRSGEPVAVLEAHDVLFTGSDGEWEAFFAEHPEARATTRLVPTGAGAVRALARFATIRRDVARATTHGEALVHVDEHRVIDAGGATEIIRHPSAMVPLADWMWCGHRVWGYSMLLVWFDAVPDALARWFEGRSRVRAATPTPETPEPRPDWEIGLDGDLLFVRRSYDEPTDSHQLQWERWALDRVLQAPFELLSWRVTESDMGGLDAWGRDRDSLRAYLSPDADPARREALRASYRASSTEVVACGTPEITDALRAVLPALGSAPVAAPSIVHLRALARSGARARFPRRIQLSIPPSPWGDREGFALLSALEDAVAGTVTFSIGWQRT